MKVPGHAKCECFYASVRPAGHTQQFEILIGGAWHPYFPYGGCTWYWATSGTTLPVRWRGDGWTREHYPSKSDVCGALKEG